MISRFGEANNGAYRYQRGRAYRKAEGPPHLCGFAWTGGASLQIRVDEGRICTPPPLADSDDLEDSGAPVSLVRTDELDWKIVSSEVVR